MLSGATSFGLHGIEAHVVEIEVDIIKGLPNITIVGLPDSTIRESKDRIRSAIENSDFYFPPKNFIVNLAPAGFKKQGPNFDLPIAVSILHSTKQTDINPRLIPMVGELSLDGRVKPIKGIISMIITLYKKGFKSVVIPYDNRHEGSAINELNIFPVKNIREALSAIKGELPPFKENYVDKNDTKYPDFSDVKGQETAKRALEIAAAGHHNIILYGAPGSGKTMLAKRLPSILPSLTKEQAIETSMIHSVGGKLDSSNTFVRETPFRHPHHTSSDAAIVGGGQIPSVGEISLSHNGILFLDEFVEFRNNVIQALRQPLEDNEITISRAAGTFVFPADFMLVAASNPCQCGYLFDDEVQCECSPFRVKNYFQKIAGPIIDRIDLEVPVNRVPYKDLLGQYEFEKSTLIKERVIKAREMQYERFKNSKTRYNSRMSSDEIKIHCKISPDMENILEIAIKRLNLTARSFFKILKASRTIADLSGDKDIQKGHLLEALSFKNLHRNYEL